MKKTLLMLVFAIVATVESQAKQANVQDISDSTTEVLTQWRKDIDTMVHAMCFKSPNDSDMVYEGKIEKIHLVYRAGYVRAEFNGDTYELHNVTEGAEYLIIAITNGSSKSEYLGPYADNEDGGYITGTVSQRKFLKKIYQLRQFLKELLGNHNGYTFTCGRLLFMYRKFRN